MCRILGESGADLYKNNKIRIKYSASRCTPNFILNLSATIEYLNQAVLNRGTYPISFHRGYIRAR